MYKMMIYIGCDIYKVEHGSCLPNAEYRDKLVGIIEGETVEDCKKKFEEMTPKGLVKWK